MRFIASGINLLEIASSDHQFHHPRSSLHAVQRHMVDTGCCKLLYDGNEDEYAEYYDYSAANEAQEGALALTEAPGAAAAVGGYELVVGGADGGAKILGSRDLAR